MNFPEISDAVRLERLRPPAGRVRMVVDTDTYNETDDQFVVAIGAITNVASALLTEPALAGKIVVVWRAATPSPCPIPVNSTCARTSPPPALCSTAACRWCWCRAWG